MKPAEATIERSWLEFPHGIGIEAWGKDHNTTILYAETRVVDHSGVLRYDDPHMRGDGRTYPTRLHNGVLVYGHDDFMCLKDAEAAGLLSYDEDEGIVRFTDEGWAYVQNLRRERGLRKQRNA